MNVTDYLRCSFRGITILNFLSLYNADGALCLNTAVCIAMMKLKNATGRKKGKGRLEFECHKKMKSYTDSIYSHISYGKHKLSL
jgi:hypothetical protein